MHRRHNRWVKVYLDMCCLKRPFDDQSQPRIRVEAEAVLALLSASDHLSFVASLAHTLENRRNPIASRAARVQAWLDELVPENLDEDQLEERLGVLIAHGFKPFDAFHLACAELSAAEVFVSTDDRLVKASRRMQDLLQTRVTDPVSFVGEVFP